MALVRDAYGRSAFDVRADLVEAHSRVWERIGLPGTWWGASERGAIARTVRAALCDTDPLAPWVAPSTDPGRLDAEPDLDPKVQDAVYRLTLHAATLTEDWYRQVLDDTAITPEQWVEIIEVVISVVCVDRFAEMIDAPAPAFPRPQTGEPSRVRPPARPARHHWVPVLHVEDATDEFAMYGPSPTLVPPVVRALTLVPSAKATLDELGSAQYIPHREMVDLNWTRGPLDRRQVELVAGRLSALRECFY